jgi:hypothetical protein
MSDTNMPTKAQPSTLTIYPEANGSCSVRNQDGSRGGFFVSYEAARRFVKAECARYRQADMA